jgi:hypothetical protein
VQKRLAQTLFLVVSTNYNEKSLILKKKSIVCVTS